MSLARSLLGSIADLCWPPACLVCGSSVGSATTLVCDRCRASIVHHGAVCRRCGSGVRKAATHHAPGGTPKIVCSDCRLSPPPYLQGRSIGPHVPPLSTLIYHLKYRHRPALAPILARWLEEVRVRAGWEAEVIVPVPTTPWRRWRRGYNQAELLAQELGALAHIPVACPLSRRHGPSQVGADFARRARNVRGRFRVRSPREVLHKRVLLVDDVLTTGATVHEVSATLLASGARAVYVLTLTSTGATRAPEPARRRGEAIP